jgi:hypothetical protein
LEATLLNLLFANLELLDFSSDRSGEGIDETDVLGYFEMGDLTLAEIANLRIGRGFAGAKADPSQDDFP